MIYIRKQGVSDPSCPGNSFWLKASILSRINFSLSESSSWFDENIHIKDMHIVISKVSFLVMVFYFYKNMICYSENEIISVKKN